MRNKLRPCPRIAAMLSLGSCARAEAGLVPGMLMAAGESFSEGAVPGGEAWDGDGRP